MQITSNPYQGKENGFYLPLARRMPPRRTGDRIPPRPTVPVWYRPLRDNTRMSWHFSRCPATIFNHI
jgi:hypothetical protein